MECPQCWQLAHCRALTLLVHGKVWQDLPLINTVLLTRALRLSPARVSSISSLTVAAIRPFDSPAMIQEGPATMVARDKSPEAVICDLSSCSDSTLPLASRHGTANHFRDEIVGFSINGTSDTEEPKNFARAA